MIAQEIIDRVIEATDIVAVASEHIRLHRAGASWKGLCPFHNDRTASLYVSPAKGIYKCFACGAGGNAAKLLMELEGISFPEAVRRLAAKAGIDIPEDEETEEERQARLRAAGLESVLLFAEEFYKARVGEPEPAAFIASRGFKDAAVFNDFGVGFAPNSYTSLRDAALAKGYTAEQLTDAGLLSEKNGDRFRSRLIFPFYTHTGKIVGFTGRDLSGAHPAKYLNSPETELYHKGQILFGLWQARREIAKTSKCYLVEGQFDVLRMVSAGYTNTVCGSGTSLTASQARLIRRFAENVTIVYDADDPGRKAAAHNIPILLDAGLSVRVVSLPEGQDPDSYLQTATKADVKQTFKAEEDVVQFLWRVLPHGDAYESSAAVRTIIESLVVMTDTIARGGLLRELSELSASDIDICMALLREVMGDSPRRVHDQIKYSGFEGLDDLLALPADKRPECTLTWDPDLYAQDWDDGLMLLVCGQPRKDDIIELRGVCSCIRVELSVSIPDSLVEPDEIRLLSQMHRSGFTITVVEKVRKWEHVQDNDDDAGTKRMIDSFVERGWIEYYVSLYKDFSDASEYTRSTVIERVAEEISYADSTVLTTNLRSYASKLGIPKGDLEKVLKPYISRRKAERGSFSQSVSDDAGENISFDPNELPSYVREDKEIEQVFRKHGFFPLLDKRGRAVAYVFQKGSSFVRVGNFYIEPLLHIYSIDDKENKRVVKLTLSHRANPIYMDWQSKEMISLQTFRARLWSEGDICFSNGDQRMLNDIMDSWAGRFARCVQLREFGWQPEGFFAFANGIWHERDGLNQFDEVSELGLVRHGDHNFYIPAFSKLYETIRSDDNQFFLDRYLKFKEPDGSPISFADWGRLMDEVYKMNNNGKFAIIYAIMCAFRSLIYDADRMFTALFFVGPTGCGKSEIAYSIRAIYMPQTAPAFNLNTGSTAALFTLMERYRDIPMMLEEYNDQQIEDAKFQGLKSAVYDGEGKQKRKAADSKDIDSSKVNAPLILLGQESPQRDDNSLANRCVILDVPKNDNRSEGERRIFLQLKDIEKQGLHHLLVKILEIRPQMKKHYSVCQDQCIRELRDRVNCLVSNTEGLTRMLNTSSIFLAVCKVVEQHTDLELPFSYGEFLSLVVEKVVKQVESISTSNRIYSFFTIIDALIDDEEVLQGREYKIEHPRNGLITLQKTGKETYQYKMPDALTRVIHINLPKIYIKYARRAGKEALSVQSLSKYLESCEYFIGRCNGTRWTWHDVSEQPKDPLSLENHTVQDDPIGGGTMPVMNPDLTVRRVMRKQSTTAASVVLNYDQLKEMLGIDLERNGDYEEQDEPQQPIF